MAQHPPEAGTPAIRECPDCGTVAGVVDGRAPGWPRQYARDRMSGKYGEVMPPLYPGSRLRFLRPVEGGLEWPTDMDNLDPCDREGRPLAVGDGDAQAGSPSQSSNT